MTIFRAVIDFTAAELAGLTAEECDELSRHQFYIGTDCVDPVPLATHAFTWCESMAATVAAVLEVNAKLAGDVVAVAFRPEPL